LRLSNKFNFYNHNLLGKKKHTTTQSKLYAHITYKHTMFVLSISFSSVFKKNNN